MSFNMEPLEQPSSSVAAEGAKLFIGDLSRFCTEQDLRVHFESYGTIIEAKIIRSGVGKSLRYGFITMDSAEAAQQAMTALDGFVVRGRPLKVRLAGHREDEATPLVSMNSVHVKFHLLQVSFGSASIFHSCSFCSKFLLIS
jgi:RNA recognition motif-containing protein